LKSLQEKLTKVVNITVCLVAWPVPEQGSSLIEVGDAVKRCNTSSQVAIIVALFVLGTTVWSCDKKLTS
jgi:hypothetical protein